MDKVFRIYAIALHADGYKTVEGVLEVARTATREVYEDARRLFRARMPEQVEWLYDVC